MNDEFLGDNLSMIFHDDYKPLLRMIEKGEMSADDDLGTIQCLGFMCLYAEINAPVSCSCILCDVLTFLPPNEKTFAGLSTGPHVLVSSNLTPIDDYSEAGV